MIEADIFSMQLYINHENDAKLLINTQENL